MNKSTLRLIANLNALYDITWNVWVTTKEGDIRFTEYPQKLRLIRKIAKQVEEQSRGFLKSKIDYKKGAEFILLNQSLSYGELHEGITKVLIGVANTTSGGFEKPE